ncbi:flagellar hook assembly protein FlgD [Cereibacter sphaeroides]|uniref:flagellar hook assembly protein FlgD n=1 Tax=Cereibacter sphaeroides TaxID=1063 RepID=UPI001F1AB916|nr:flagellar hook capping FlgD N-terminal domain-containing protein [Cereibacter sphaeroides]MCE6960919.1 flagellar hook assembly protein FlgD [Cereibacter sphaeroides]MCE6969783.1 flagellar hook assembly protein FlgD [Cereibacter sphaeroides]MCE6975258.1 flagellar hook assembly protein FlgD [Cereibacter sphaeroides]
MDITPTTAGTGTQGATSPPATTSDYQTFLRMLTTELQNQDPMDPMDSKEFALQLATFSGVEQQVKTNDLLTTMSGSLGVMGLSELAGWIGREARVAAPAWFDGAPITISPNPVLGADRANLVVRDADGGIVAQEAIEAEAGPIDWAGTDAEGNPLPEGAYSFSIESYTGDELLGTTDVEVYSEVVEARGGSNGTILVLRGGVEVAASSVTALRDASRS